MRLASSRLLGFGSASYRTTARIRFWEHAEMDDETRRSWNFATRNHNAHKGDQAAFFRAGGDVLFSEELELLGPLQGRDVAHLQCNAGQDTLSLVHHGARATGVDFSDEAIAFARQLSADSGVPATFIESEIISWLETTPERFDLAFTSYGTTPWLSDLEAWARGVERILRPGGALVYVEFHPLIWSLGPALDLTRRRLLRRGPVHRAGRRLRRGLGCSARRADHRHDHAEHHPCDRLSTKPRRHRDGLGAGRPAARGPA